MRVVIADRGVGIPPQARSRLFEPFYSTKKDVGTGLGLWVSKSLIEKHDGSICFRSCVLPGRSGTVFSIFLPLRRGIWLPGRRPHRGKLLLFWAGVRAPRLKRKLCALTDAGSGYSAQ